MRARPRRTLLAFVAAIALVAGWTQLVLGQTVIRRSNAITSSIGVGSFGDLTPKGLSAVAQLRLVEQPGYRTPLHIHASTDETFYVLEGTLTLFVDGERVDLSAGDYVFLPRGTAHAQGNLTTGRVVLLTTLVPGDFAAFFHERAELVKRVPPEHPDYPARMRELGTRHDIRIIGPAPF